eukprot:m51a1_g10131 hypothetical protein (834) ;mRNA; f:7325-14011
MGHALPPATDVLATPTKQYSYIEVYDFQLVPMGAAQLLSFADDGYSQVQLPWQFSLGGIDYDKMFVSRMEYSFIEVYDFQLVLIDNAQELSFDDGYAPVQLPWKFSFGGISYDKMFVSQRGWINFGSNGADDNPMVAPTRGTAASSWLQKSLTTQAVLTQQGDIFYVYSGSRHGIISYSSVSTGTIAGATWSSFPGGLSNAWRLENPAVAPVALRLAPRDASPIRLPLFVNIAAEGASPAVWSHVMGAKISTICSSEPLMTFLPQHNINRLAITNAIDVSCCSTVLVSGHVGPDQASETCRPVAYGVYVARMDNALSSPKGIIIGRGQNMVFLVIPPTTTRLYLMLSADDSGWVFGDELSVTCMTSRPYTESSSSARADEQYVLTTPTKEYSFIEVYDFQLVPMGDAQELMFANGFAQVQLPWQFSFGGINYDKMFVSLSWQQGGLTTQAVLAQQGDIYYVYSGSRAGITSTPSVSTGTVAGVTWSSVPGGLTGTVSTACSSEPVMTFLPNNNINRLAITNAIDVSHCSTVVVSGHYSFIEVYDFQLVLIDNAQELSFVDGYTPVQLQWKFSFGGINYDKMFVSQRGWINFGSNGANDNPMVAPTRGTAASSVRELCLDCNAPYPTGPCCVVQWLQGSLTTQAVLTQQGDIYYVYSGSRFGIISDASVSTGTIGGATWSSFPGGLTNRISTECSSEPLMTFLPDYNINRLAITNAIDVSRCSTVLVSGHVGPDQASETCRSVAYGVYVARMDNALSSPKGGWIGRGQNMAFLVIPPTTTRLYLMLSADDSGWVFGDELSVTCMTSRPYTESSSSVHRPGLVLAAILAVSVLAH